MPAKAVSNSPYNIRTYQPSDFDKYVLLITEAERLNPTGRCVSPQFIAEQLRRPNYRPEQDLFIAEKDNNILGSINIEPELAIGRVILDCSVRPEQHNSRGLTMELYNSAMRRARELRAKVAHANIREDNITAIDILVELGFTFVRRFLELTRDISCSDGLGTHLTRACHCLRPGQEDTLAKLQNCAFAGTWGYNPNTVEEIIFRIGIGSCSRKDIVLIYDGDKAIGCCWTGIICEEGIPSLSKGRIHMLGVDPDYRGKGIGRELMMAGLARLKNRGLKVVELTVDSENTIACALYASLGFEIQSSTLWYEKAVGSGTEAV
ncbi:MAG: GNAT family N-acetyltransferase [Chloroflexota bacterium]|nr:MAG: GNAT family N-acetyltransferase [Chloroflexota bacterium]